MPCQKMWLLKSCLVPRLVWKSSQKRNPLQNNPCKIERSYRSLRSLSWRLFEARGEIHTLGGNTYAYPIFLMSCPCLVPCYVSSYAHFSFWLSTHIVIIWEEDCSRPVQTFLSSHLWHRMAPYDKRWSVIWTLDCSRNWHTQRQSFY